MGKNIGKLDKKSQISFKEQQIHYLQIRNLEKIYKHYLQTINPRLNNESKDYKIFKEMIENSEQNFQKLNNFNFNEYIMI